MHDHQFELEQCIHAVGTDLTLSYREVDLARKTPVRLWNYVLQPDGTPAAGSLNETGTFAKIRKKEKFTPAQGDVGTNILFLTGFENGQFVQYKFAMIQIVP
jgi:hypothetical protein